MRKYDKRVIFPVNKQKHFLCGIKEELNFTWPQFAARFNVHPRSLNDWKREAVSMPLMVVKKITREMDMSMPSDIEIREPFWYANEGSKLGWKVVMEKYGHVGGDPEYRKRKRHEWWQKEGRYKVKFIGATKAVSIPRLSKRVAEFAGIVMGDGSLTKWQLQITFHKINDAAYADFVKGLIEEIFKVPVSICYKTKAMALILVVSRKKLVEFCDQKLGLIVGHKIKQGLDIPDWIKKDFNFQKACVRGLVDTDGCVFNETHRIGGKIYSYKRLNFTSASPALRQTVFNFFEKLDLLPKIRNDKCVQIEKKNKIEEYFNVIGTNNPKHKKRFTEGCSER